MLYNIVFLYPNVICLFNCQVRMGKSNVFMSVSFMYVFLPKISLICHIWAGASRWFFGWAFLNYFVHPNTTIKSQTRSSFKLHISLENETAGRFGLHLTFGWQTVWMNSAGIPIKLVFFHAHGKQKPKFMSK